MQFKLMQSQLIHPKLMRLTPIKASMCFVMLCIFISPQAYSQQFIAGIKPDQRPAHAPQIKKINRNKAWYEKSLTGIRPPYPESLYFLDNQGNWYSPFTRPGMTGPYDIRGWHR